MKVRTHYHITKTAIRLYLNENHIKMLSVKEKIFIEILCLSSMLPDISPGQFVHHHFYGKSHKYILKKINRLCRRKRLGMVGIINLGKIVHYLSDFCCYAHLSESICNPREHMLYERRLNKFAIKNLKLPQERLIKGIVEKIDSINIGKSISDSKPVKWLKHLREYYLNMNKSFENDLLLSVVSAKEIFEKVPAIQRFFEKNV